MDDLFDTITQLQGARMRSDSSHKTRRKTKSKALEARALELAMGGSDFVQDSSWIDVDHHLAARSTKESYDFDFDAGPLEEETETTSGEDET